MDPPGGLSILPTRYSVSPTHPFPNDKSIFTFMLLEARIRVVVKRTPLIVVEQKKVEAQHQSSKVIFLKIAISWVNLGIGFDAFGVRFLNIISK